MKINKQLRFIGYLLLTGILATTTMDMVALIMVKCGLIHLGHYQIGPNMLGRWIGYLPAGILFHSTILETPPIAHEKVLGILSHNLIGITLTTLLVYPHTRIWRQRIGLGTALLFGIGTCVLPYFVLFPALGFGVMGLKVAQASQLMSFSALNHAAFGAGIFIWSQLLHNPFFKLRRNCSLPTGALPDARTILSD